MQTDMAAYRRAYPEAYPGLPLIPLDESPRFGPWLCGA